MTHGKIRVEKVAIKSETGDILRGDLYFGKGAGKKLRTMVLFSHGMMSNRSGKATLMAKLAAESGNNALAFDFGGCGESSGELYPISYERRLLDLEAAIEFSIEEGGAGKLALVGSSMGGALSIIMGAGYPEVGMVAALAPPSNDDVLQAAPNLGKPLYIVHGSCDEIVYPWRSEKIAEAAGLHTLRLIEDGADHSLGDRMDRIGPEIIGWIDEASSSPGSYQVLIRADSPVTGIKTGGSGNNRSELPAGFYLYSGSAGSGIESRVCRHLRNRSRIHWHIDRLLSAPGAKVLAVHRYPGNRWPGVDEHLLHKAAAGLPGAEIPAPGFGSSDCRAGCKSHLLRFPEIPKAIPWKTMEAVLTAAE